MQGAQHDCGAGRDGSEALKVVTCLEQAFGKVMPAGAPQDRALVSLASHFLTVLALLPAILHSPCRSTVRGRAAPSLGILAHSLCSASSWSHGRPEQQGPHLLASQLRVLGPRHAHPALEALSSIVQQLLDALFHIEAQAYTSSPGLPQFSQGWAWRAEFSRTVGATQLQHHVLGHLGGHTQTGLGARGSGTGSGTPGPRACGVCQVHFKGAEVWLLQGGR